MRTGVAAVASCPTVASWGYDMPKMIVHAPEGTFDAGARREVAKALSELGLACEALPTSPFVKSTVWIYFSDYAAGTVFMGAEPAYRKVVTLQVYLIRGGLAEDGKRRLIEGATAIVGRYTASAAGVPAWVVIHEIAESDWGLFGRRADLAALRAGAADAAAI